MSFKVGDRVVYTNKHYEPNSDDGRPYKYMIGLKGTIEGVVMEGGTHVTVAWDATDTTRHPCVTVWSDNVALLEEHDETILDEAKRLVYGARNAEYGHPHDDMSRTAKIWSAILGIDVTPEQVGLCMCGVKISRQVNKRKRDNLVDLAGYAEVTHRIVSYEEGNENDA